MVISSFRRALNGGELFHFKGNSEKMENFYRVAFGVSNGFAKPKALLIYLKNVIASSVVTWRAITLF